MIFNQSWVKKSVNSHVCISRGVLGYRWEKGMNGGERQCLYPADMRRLHDNIAESAYPGITSEFLIFLQKKTRIKIQPVETSKKPRQLLCT